MKKLIIYFSGLIFFLSVLINSYFNYYTLDKIISESITGGTVVQNIMNIFTVDVGGFNVIKHGDFTLIERNQNIYDSQFHRFISHYISMIQPKHSFSSTKKSKYILYHSTIIYRVLTGCFTKKEVEHQMIKELLDTHNNYTIYSYLKEKN